MCIVSLSDADRVELRRLVRSAPRVRISRRAQALLALDRGETVASVARQVEAGGTSVRRWARWYQERGEAPVAERLDDAVRSGRPRAKRDAVEKRLDTLLEVSPIDLGYRHTTWTTPLLQAHLGSEGLETSPKTIRRSLHALGYRWKRPRYVLSRRSPTWRQAKGGSNAD
ncbi:helix-turn-helix domain-containing protein [Candidatus Poribacteria bacterium]|jgi:transposase|nr:helix-turn-helix domain-containing protein [Candidatus Poribacteria bacterium]MBT5714965.1 helix-turn-helix domain-containing protein [Candidatus Poribacteria bacterium]MBT7097568.1 helix-turn-helix domain-containing protein [Candidatus Poribacteria bacterium]MBT7806939.1 helix-turn-helix domain-containing protein [Candidatus Poribacteria bacterium]